MNLGTQRYVIMISVLVRNVPRVVRIRFEGSLGYEQGSVMMDA